MHGRTFTVLSIKQLSCLLRICPRTHSQYSVLNNFPVSFEFVWVDVSTFTELGIERVACLLRIRPRTRAHVHRTLYWMSCLSPSNSSAYTCARSQYSVLNNFPVFLEFVRVHVRRLSVLGNKQFSGLFFLLVSVHVHSTWYKIILELGHYITSTLSLDTLSWTLHHAGVLSHSHLTTLKLNHSATLASDHLITRTFFD